nr:MAG TPA: hypothetical protein [Caudoviricetes sp.]
MLLNWSMGHWLVPYIRRIRRTAAAAVSRVGLAGCG